MPHYNLEPDEFEIRQEAGVSLYNGGEFESISEIVLTNRHLVLVDSTGVFNIQYYAKYCPLEEITYYQGFPQVTVARIRDREVVQVPFESEAVCFYLHNGNSKRWANAIKQAALGDFEGIAQKDAVIEQVEDLADGAAGIASAIGGGIVGSIVGGIGGIASQVIGNADPTKKRKDLDAAPANRGKCQGCHAPLDGRSGMTVTCEYCGTKQTL